MAVTFIVVIASPQAALAATFPPESATGSIGLQGTISTAPPTRGATITTPVTGATFTNIPITVTGLCPSGLLIKLFSNQVFVGSTYCSNGSYSMKSDLFAGLNSLVAIDYDALDQPGPDSNVVNVTFNDSQTALFGSRVSLTSQYARRGVDPGSSLSWPIIVSGGKAPYAISVDWGDGSPTQLISQSSAGTLSPSHVYKSAGIYTVIFKATDVNGTTAYLQVIAVANGAIQSNQSSKGASGGIVKIEVLWWPALVMFPLIPAAFFIGRRHELFSLRKKLEKSRTEV